MGPKKRPRSTEKSSDNPDDPESSNICKGCNKEFKSVLKHLTRSKTNCIKQYTDSEYESLGQEGISKSQAKKSRREAENYASTSQKKKEEKSQYHQRNKECNPFQVADRHQRSYKEE